MTEETRGHSTAATARHVEANRHRDKPLAPAYLTVGATAVWYEVMEAVAADHFEPGDYRTLAAYCEACALLERMSADADEEPYTITDDKGGVKVNPFHTLFKNTGSQLQTLAIRLKLVPSSRGKESAGAKNARRAGQVQGSTRRQQGLMWQGGQQGDSNDQDA